MKYQQPRFSVFMPGKVQSWPFRKTIKELRDSGEYSEDALKRLEEENPPTTAEPEEKENE